MRALAAAIPLSNALAVLWPQTAPEALVDVKGTVLNSATGQPIGGALVELDPGPRLVSFVGDGGPDAVGPAQVIVSR